jgi:hypothetical protein
VTCADVTEEKRNTAATAAAAATGSATALIMHLQGETAPDATTDFLDRI